METAVNEPTETEILWNAVENLDEANRKHVAAAVIQLSLPKRVIDRVNYLLELNRNGAISVTERGELDKYLRVGNLLGTLKSRARQTLNDTTQA